MRSRIVVLLAALALIRSTRAEEACCAPATGLTYSGFVDASYSGNLDQGGDGFRLDQVELDLQHRTAEGLILRADLESSGDGAISVEQGWLKLPLPLAPKWSLTVGKFNAPIGAELLDAPDMYQYSHSLVFDHCLPTNLTGALVEGPVFGPVDLKLYVVNGWDNNDEDNPSRSLGLRAGVDMGLAGSMGLSFLTGREEAVKTAGVEDLQVIDVDYLLRPRDNLLLLAELNMGRVEPVGGESLGWIGWLAAAHLDLTETWSCTLRYDMVMDDDGVLFGPIATENQTRSSITAALCAAAGPGRTIVLEARMDASDQDAFLDADDEAKRSTLGLAIEFTQAF